jgi:hypothetical protein
MYTTHDCSGFAITDDSLIAAFASESSSPFDFPEAGVCHGGSAYFFPNCFDARLVASASILDSTVGLAMVVMAFLF